MNNLLKWISVVCTTFYLTVEPPQKSYSQKQMNRPQTIAKSKLTDTLPTGPQKINRDSLNQVQQAELLAAVEDLKLEKKILLQENRNQRLEIKALKNNRVQGFQVKMIMTPDTVPPLIFRDTIRISDTVILSEKQYKKLKRDVH